jgi:antitoxin MazE
MVLAKVQKWGKSQGLRLSRQVLDLAEIEVGDDLEIIVGQRQILMRKIARPKFDLSELVTRIPKDYRAEEIDFGPPVGKEQW